MNILLEDNNKNDIMVESALVGWSRAQFALTAAYHWIFVPLTLGLAVIMATMETIYVVKGDEFWKKTAKFWIKRFMRTARVKKQ